MNTISVLWRCWLGGRKGIRPVKNEWWGVGVVVCLERGAGLHMAQLMPLPLTVSCSSKIQIGFTFLVPAYPGCPGKEAVKWLLLLLLFVPQPFNSYKFLINIRSSSLKTTMFTYTSRLLPPQHKLVPDISAISRYFFVQRFSQCLCFISVKCYQC